MYDRWYHKSCSEAPVVVDVRKPRRYPTRSIDFGDDVLDALERLCAETGRKLSPTARDLVADRLREMGRLAPIQESDSNEAE
jgi:hypothetical protein